MPPPLVGVRAPSPAAPSPALVVRRVPPRTPACRGAWMQAASCSRAVQWRAGIEGLATGVRGRQESTA